MIFMAHNAAANVVFAVWLQSLSDRCYSANRIIIARAEEVFVRLPPLLCALHSLFLFLAPVFIYKEANSDVGISQSYNVAGAVLGFIATMHSFGQKAG